ncbi:MaoC family dehydratase [Microbacterium sp. RD1]|uniref:MaoC family dehydratase n=1 Tax=Microbacterium sp. RD1 TaxID=3457313 RepID=UPI003FA598FC
MDAEGNEVDTGSGAVELCGATEIEAIVGQTLGWSSWQAITQRDVDRFADVTGDHQWIHTDPTRAATGPFGTTIAHGYLTLALIPRLLNDVVQISGFSATLNYGLNRVRFPAAVPVGSRIRLSGLSRPSGLLASATNLSSRAS